MTLNQIREAVQPACRDFQVKRLEAFGSVTRGTSGGNSDLDLLVEFSEPETHFSRRFFGLLHSLEDRLGCDVDLLTVDSLRNPYFRQRVLREKVPLYER